MVEWFNVMKRGRSFKMPDAFKEMTEEKYNNLTNPKKASWHLHRASELTLSRGGLEPAQQSSARKHRIAQRNLADKMSSKQYDMNANEIFETDIRDLEMTTEKYHNLSDADKITFHQKEGGLKERDSLIYHKIGDDDRKFHIEMIRRLRGDIPSIDKNTYPSIKEFERYQKIVNPLSHKERGLDRV